MKFFPRHIFFLIVFLAAESFAQSNGIISALNCPYPPNIKQTEAADAVQSYLSKWYGCSISGSTGIIKSTLNNPGSITFLSSSSRTLFGAARSALGIFYGLEYTSPGAGNLVTIDTAAGGLVIVAPLSGLGAGHVVTGMALDRTTGIMYVTSLDGTLGRLYTINLTTGVLTTVASSMSGTTYPIDIAINNSGVMYSCDINTDALNVINKVTGTATPVGSLGINISFAQGMAFDPETDSLFLAAYTDAGKLYRCNTTTGAATLIGTIGTGNEVDAFIIPPPVVRQLNAFNLQSPSSSSRIVTVAGSTTPITFSWDTSGAGAAYKFIFGNPSVPPRRFSISSSSNFITTTLGSLDAILAANGFTNNGSATDSAVGEWDVWAYKGLGAPGADSLKASNGPRPVTFRRQQNQLNSFGLVSPSSPFTFVTSPVDTSKISFVWRSSGSGNTYRWLFKNSGTYSDPATFRFQANSSGFDTLISIRNSFIDSALASLGIAMGDSLSGTWRVRAYSFSDSLNSAVPDRQVTFKRASLVPLDQPFTELNFPPLFWTLDYTGTLYWSRETPSGYGNGSGSARFKFWSADVGTTQSLISNQFTPTSPGPIYLRFDYAYRFYLDGTGNLIQDSLGIFTSTNNGATWASLSTLKATQTPQGGINSTNNMTTASGTGEYTSPSNSEWGTKIFAFPLGTNKVKFTAYSSYGNNLFLDNIKTFLFVGSTEIKSKIPENYSLEQNYPNPFNPATTIKFSIPQQSYVTLKIYDMLGRETAVLFNQNVLPGSYSVNFSAENLSSGYYFYKLEAGEFVGIKKMIFIK